MLVDNNLLNAIQKNANDHYKPVVFHLDRINDQWACQVETARMMELRHAEVQ